MKVGSLAYPHLFTISSLTRYGIVSRPSISIKSPYVADVTTSFTTNPFDRVTSSPAARSMSPKEKRSACADVAQGIRDTQVTQLAHAPSLDCQGMVASGTNVLCTPSTNPTAKTDCVIQICEEARLPSDGGNVTVGYHPTLAETAAKAMFEKKLITDEFGPFDSFSTQVTYPACSGNRYDFALHTSTSMTLVEVKNVVGAEYVTGAVPSCRSHVGVYCVEPSELPKTGRKPHERHAIFPHGAKKTDIGVVSDRAIKHVHHLTELHGTTDPCTGKQVRCGVLFVVNRGDCTAFRPCHEACSLFAQILQRAVSVGVVVVAKEVVHGVAVGPGPEPGLGPNDDTIDTDISALSSIDSLDFRLGLTLPVTFSDAVRHEEMDMALVKRVLHYNKVVPKTRTSPSPKKRKEISVDDDSGGDGGGAGGIGDGRIKKKRTPSQRTSTGKSKRKT